MGHHNFSLGEDLVSQMALRGMQEHLEERAKRKSIKAAEPEEPTQEELEGALRKLAEREIPDHRFGSTGRYPLGHFSTDDEGELRFGIAVQAGRVLIDFGKPVHCLGLDADQAEGLARTLQSRAAEARAQTKALERTEPQG